MTECLLSSAAEQTYLTPRPHRSIRYLPVQMSALALAVCCCFAHADCTGSAGTYVCDGALTSAISITDTDISVTTRDEFSINVTGTDPALSLTGSGSIVYQDDYTATLSSPGSSKGALSIRNDTTDMAQDASVTVVTGGSITGGIQIDNTGSQAATVNVDVSGSIDGGQESNSIYSYNTAYQGDALTKITATGDITATNGKGIQSSNSADNGNATLTIAAGNITAGYAGIFSDSHANQGDALTEITVTGNITATNGNGIYSNNHTSTGNSKLTIAAGSITAGQGGIYSSNSTNQGDALTEITVTGNITATGDYSSGIYSNNYTSTGNATLTIAAGNITAMGDYAYDYGIYSTNSADNGNATLTIAAGSIVGYGGIYSSNTTSQGDASTTITVGDITATNGYGIESDNRINGGGNATQTIAAGDITATNGFGIQGTNFSDNGNATQTITAGNMNASWAGIASHNGASQGDASTKITVGDITATNGYGIFSNNVSSDGGNATVTIAADNISADQAGILSNNSAYQGDASTEITVGDITTITTTYGYGIQSINRSDNGNATLTIAAGSITAGDTGILSDNDANQGDASTKITVTGSITATNDYSAPGYGIYTQTSVYEGRSDVIVDVNSIDSGNDAIHIVDDITDNTSAVSTITIATHGDIVSLNGTGIYVETTDADSYLTVSGLVHGGGGTAIDVLRMNGIERSATLELRAGYALEGVTLATVDNTTLDPANTHLVLGGSGNAGFDLSRIDNSADAIETGDANRITGFGTLTKSGDSVWTLSGANSADPADAFLYVNVDAGILALDAATLVLADAGSASGATGIVTVAAGAGLSSIGASTVRGDVVNSGSIILANDYSGGNGSFVGDTLTISGNYTSNGGNLYLNTVLGDSSSATDKLVANTVTTGAGGATRVYVTNVGGLGALTSGDGIQIVQVATSSGSDAFVLGKPVAAGLYEYVLNQGTDQSWYLSSYLQPEPGPDDAGSEQPPLYNPATGAYLSNQTAATTLFMHTLYDRQGHANHQSTTQTAWARVVTRHGTGESVGGSQKTRTNSDLVHLGVDIGTWQVQDGNLHAGIMGAYGKSKTRVTSKATGTWADGRLDGYSLGVYGTWFADEAEGKGLYVDGWTQYSWFKNKISGSAQVNGEEKYDSRLWTISAEAGYGFLVGKTADTEIMLTPQIQIAYNDYSADSHTDGNGLRVSGDKGSGAVTRVGARLYGRSTSVFTARPYVEVNWIYSDAKNTLNFNGEVLRDDVPHNRLEAKLGVQGTIAKNWTLWGQAGVQWGKDSYHRYEGQFGLKYQW